MIVKNYMAILRNLRNVLNANVSDYHLDKVVNAIKDKNAVRKSKQFPFRFFSAYRELDNMSHDWDDDYFSNYDDDNDKTPVNPRTSDVLDALEKAIEISYENIPYMKGTTLIACDVSGSMETSVSKRSKLQYFDIGLLLGSAMHKYTDKGIIGMFGTSWKQIQLGKTSSGIIANTIKMHEREGEVGYATNGYKVIQWLNNTNTHVDRILILTDCQMWDTDYRYDFDNRESTIRKEYNEYKKNINPNVNLYLFNVNGYGNVNFPKDDRTVVNINGWSDKILKFIQVHEADPDAQIKHIKEKY